MGTLTRLLASVALMLIGLSAHAGDFDSRYVPKTGDLNGDGLTDIYLHYQPKLVTVDVGDLIVPIPTSKRTLGDFVLQQETTGGFTPIAISSAQRAAVIAWQRADIKVQLGDFNLDGYQDAVLGNVRQTVPTAMDAIVIAPPAQGAIPPHVRSIDSELLQFVQDVDAWAKDHNYFASGWVTEWELELEYVPLYDCDGFTQVGDPNNGNAYAYPGCGFLGWDYYWVWSPYTYYDATRFSANAREFVNLLAPYVYDAQRSLTDADAASMGNILSQALGFTTMPMPNTVDVPPPVHTPEFQRLKDLIRILIRAGRVGSGPIAVLIPSPVADATLSPEEVQQAHEALLAVAIEAASAENPGFITLYHGTTVQSGLALLNGAPLDAEAAEANRNFRGDELGFYLATDPFTAAHWGTVAAQRHRTEAVVIRYRFTTAAHSAVLQAGARYRRVDPITDYQMDAGYELVVPVRAFAVFNSLRQQGQIIVTPW